MRFRLLVLALAASLVAAPLLPTPAAAQDRPPAAGVVVPVEVRVDRTIVDPGAPLEGAWAAFVEPGQGPLQAAPRAVATDPEGRCLVEGPAGGGVLLKCTRPCASTQR